MALSPENYPGGRVAPFVAEGPPRLPSSGVIYDSRSHNLPPVALQAMGMATWTGLSLTEEQIGKYAIRRNEPPEAGSPMLSDQRILAEVLDPVQREVFKAQHPHIFPTLQ